MVMSAELDIIHQQKPIEWIFAPFISALKDRVFQRKVINEVLRASLNHHYLFFSCFYGLVQKNCVLYKELTVVSCWTFWKKASTLSKASVILNWIPHWAPIFWKGTIHSLGGFKITDGKEWVFLTLKTVWRAFLQNSKSKFSCSSKRSKSTRSLLHHKEHFPDLIEPLLSDK